MEYITYHDILFKIQMFYALSEYIMRGDGELKEKSCGKLYMYIVIQITNIIYVIQIKNKQELFLVFIFFYKIYFFILREKIWVG